MRYYIRAEIQRFLRAVDLALGRTKPINITGAENRLGGWGYRLLPPEAQQRVRSSTARAAA